MLKRRTHARLTDALLILAAGHTDHTSLCRGHHGQERRGPRLDFQLKSEGNKLTGAMVSAEGKELPIKDAKLDGDPFLSPWIPSGKASRSSWW